MRLLCLLVCAAEFATRLPGAPGARIDYGPYNAAVLPDGEGLKEPVRPGDSVLRADAPWTLYCWVQPAENAAALTLVAGLGDPAEEYPRYLALDRGQLVLWMGEDNRLSADVPYVPGTWHLIAATFDGARFHLYSDGTQIAQGELLLGSVGPELQVAPSVPPSPACRHFGGKVASLALISRALSAPEIARLHETPVAFDLVTFDEASRRWPVQVRAWPGYQGPQDPSEMPRGRAPLSAGTAQPLPPATPELEEAGDGRWTLSRGWKLAAAPRVTATGAEISKPGFDAGNWWPATVPGTVLTTMVDRGVYPDPDYGLNNLAIPEGLNRQKYWYRVEFDPPNPGEGRRLALRFEGINYEAAVWADGRYLGSISGAFTRGTFDVTGIVRPGQANALAVCISPPPHPGIPQEQSLKGGPGENGGILCLDGPTFAATEGWDWIPALRDRNAGIWQPVTLAATGSTQIGDPQVITTLPLPQIDRADIEIDVPLDNESSAPVSGTVSAAFEGVALTEPVTLPPGTSVLKLTPAEFAQLSVEHPRLWWPNGYGRPELYHLKLTFTTDDGISDEKSLRFGIREITYELSLLDSTGHLRRVEYSPTVARRLGAKVVDVSHEGIRSIPAADPPPAYWPAARQQGWCSWVASLVPGGERSPAALPRDDTACAPYLVIKVNGVRIACRGGNWGMDDSRKRVSRSRLEPYFRLHRDAHLNMIRNWMGQSSEECFYDLADEYGLLVWNDFWESTQDHNLEPEDPELLLKNAREVILRFRNHPSIALWCGRNEGVPQPIVNRGLDELIRKLDGTRYYSPSSNRVNLQASGPYRYMKPALYYTSLNRGFSVETGTPSFPTLESFRASVSKADQWPIDDVWAYHDWHQGGGGDVHRFMEEIQTEFGAPTGLEDFERKAQMLNYVDHRAIFEGMNAHLWSPNSGRLLWMSQPAWPSTVWQIFSADYDTQASFYGVMKACEPVHIQLDLSNHEIDLVNTTTASLGGLSAAAEVYSLDHRLLLRRARRCDLAADSVEHAFGLDWAQSGGPPVVLIELALSDAAGAVLSRNLYWLSARPEDYRELTRMPRARLTASACVQSDFIRVEVRNTGTVAALETKLTLQNADGSRLLPAYYGDNYVSILPGETRAIEIQYPAAAAKSLPRIAIRGWNVAPRVIDCLPGPRLAPH